MAAALTLTTQRSADGGVELVALGEIDLSTIGRFESALRSAIDETGPGRKTSLDLRGVEYLDSAAINVLFEHADRVSRIRIEPLLQRGLIISGLDQVIEVC